jgi:serine/threonine protein kinase
MEHELPGYALRERVGAGAAAEVYRAEALGSPGRIVAVKRLRIDAGPRAVEELRREADALARLSHPSLLRILDIVPDGDRVALVLPYAVGGSLADQLAATDGGLAPSVVADLGARLASALAAAHNARLVHRDVKPGNILFDAEGQPLLGDLGTARLTCELAPVAGTAEYLDPEVLGGGVPDARTDVYGLGITLYEALAGVPPYAGSTPRQTLAAAKRGIHAPLRELTDTPSGLVDTIERAMRRDPASRFATANELAGRLDEARRQLEAGDDVVQVPPPPPRPGRAGVLGAVPERTRPDPREPWSTDGAATPRPAARSARPVTPAPSASEPAAPETSATPERSGTRLFGPAPPRPADHKRTGHGLDRRLLVAAALLAVLVPVGVAVWSWSGGGQTELALEPPADADGPAEDRDDPRPEEGGATDDGATEPGAHTRLPACEDISPPDAHQDDVVIDADVEGRGCTVPVVWDGRQLAVPMPAGETARYDLLAEPGDQLLLGDWTCDGRAAPALYRPADGQLFVFDEFSADASARGAPSGVVDGHSSVVADAEGCDRIEVEPAP